MDTSDIDEIVESHLKNGQVVERLLVTPPELGADWFLINFGLWRLMNKRLLLLIGSKREFTDRTPDLRAPAGAIEVADARRRPACPMAVRASAWR